MRSPRTAEWRRLPQRLERAFWIGREQRPHDSQVAARMVRCPQVGERIARDHPVFHKEIEEAIDNPGTLQNRRSRPDAIAVAKPAFQRAPVDRALLNDGLPETAQGFR